MTSGSIICLWRVMYPICISMLSGFAMIFIDRIFLSRYSVEALSAISSGGTLFWMIIGFFFYLASIASVYVGKVNGAGKLLAVAHPVWNMVAFSIVSIPVFLYIAPVAVEFFYAAGKMDIYQKDFLIANYAYSPLMVLSSALSSFFIGTGRPYIVTYSGLVGNFVNVVLDYLLIFGACSLKPMGIKGAALATAIGLTVQCAIIISVILNRYNNKIYNTRSFKIDIGLFLDMIKHGGASSLALTIELIGWSAFYIIVSKTTVVNSLFVSINQSVFIFLLFFSEALEKSVSAIAGNIIGANKFQELKKLRISATKISLIFGVIISILLVIFKNHILRLFITDTSVVAMQDYEKIYDAFKYSMILLAIYITVENIRFLLKGLLVAMNNSWYIMLVEPICVWALMVLPAYILFYKFSYNIVFSLILFTIFSVITSSLLLVRLKIVEKRLHKFDSNSYE